MTDFFRAEPDPAPHDQQPEPIKNDDADVFAAGQAFDGCAMPEQAEPSIESFWSCGPEFAEVTVSINVPERTLELLEKLGPSPFERGGFPVIGFLATTYDKVTRYALEGD